MRNARGQATLELLGLLPVVVVIGLVLMQLLAVGYSAVLAGAAAESGALALASGGSAAEGVRDALPGWSRARARISVRGGRVRVGLRPPSPLRTLARRLEVRADARVELP